MNTIPLSLSSWDRLTSLYSVEALLGAMKITPASLAKSLCPGKGTQATKKHLETELADMIEKKAKAGSLERQP